MRAAEKLLEGHTCPAGAKPVDYLKDRPPYADPGQLVKVAGEEKWGRVAYLMNCCGERIVEFVVDEAMTAERMRHPDLESPYANTADLPPDGYLIPHRHSRKITAFGGPRA